MKMRTIRTLGFVGALVAIAGTGCSRKSREARYLRSADRFYTAKQFDYAAIQYLNVLRIDPTNSYAVQRLGSIYMGKGDLERAYLLLRRADQLNPENTGIEGQLGLVLLSAGERPKARDEALRILGREPANGKALLLLSDCAQGRKEIQAAHARFAGLLKSARQKGPVYLALGNLYLRQDQLAEAEAALRQALALEPKLGAVHTALANLHWARNELAAADQEFQKAAELTSEDVANAELKWGLFRLQSGNISGAKAVLEKLTRAFPEFLPGWADLGRVALAEKDFKRCHEILSRMLAINRQDYRSRMFEAELALRQGQADQAIADLEQLRKDYPSVPRVLFVLSQAYLAKNDLSLASARARQAADMSPGYTDAVLLAADLSLKQNDSAAAVTFLEGLRQRQPQDLRVQLMLAQAYQDQKRFPEALDIYRGVAKLFPTNAVPYLMMGMIYKAEQRITQARSAFGRALELAPDSAETVAQLASLDVQQGNYAGARTLAARQIDRQPKAAGLRLLLAQVQLAEAARQEADHNPAAAARTRKEAEQTLQKTIELAPTLPTPYLTLAQLYVTSGEYTAALEKCRQALSKNPRDVPALMDQGVILEQTKHYTEAAQSYERLLEVNPDFAPALNNLAYLYAVHLNEAAKALTLAQRARQLLPSDPSIADTLGWVFYMLHQYNQAAPLFQESASMLPNLPDAQFHLAMNDYMLARLDDAAPAFRRVLELAPQYERRATIQDCLATLAVDPAKANASTVQALEQRAARWPGDLVAYLRLGQIEERLGDRQKALAAYQKALSLNPKAPPVLVGLAWLESQDPDRVKAAMDLAQTVRNLQPNDPAIAALMGHLAYLMGNYQWSSSLLQDASARLPSDLQVCLDLARADYALGKVQAAKTQAAKPAAAPGFTRGDEAKRFLRFLAATGQETAAAASLQPQVEAALKGDPRDLAALMVRALIQRQAGHDAEAAEDYRKMIAAAPAFLPAMERLAALYAGPLQQEEKALDLANRVVSLAPNNVDAGKLLGILTYKHGDYRRCVTILQRLAARPTSDAQVLYYLGMAHYHLKEPKASKKALESSLALSLEPALAMEARKVLATLQ